MILTLRIRWWLFLLTLPLWIVPLGILCVIATIICAKIEVESER